MKIKKLQEQAYRENGAFLDLALQLNKKEAEKLTFEHKIARFGELQYQERLKHENTVLKEDHLESECLRKHKDYLYLVDRLQTKNRIVIQIKKCKTILLGLRTQARQSAEKYSNQIEAELKLLREFEEDATGIDQEIKEARRKIDKYYAKECLPALVALEEAITAADKADETLNSFNDKSKAILEYCRKFIKDN